MHPAYCFDGFPLIKTSPETYNCYAGRASLQERGVTGLNLVISDRTHTKLTANGQKEEDKSGEDFSIRDIKFHPDTGNLEMYFLGTNELKKVSSPVLQARIDAIDAQKAELESKYLSYADYPGVPDAGPIIGRSLSKSEAGTASWTKGMTHYYYTIVENPTFNEAAWIEWEALIDFDPLYDKYADTLVECGFSEHTIKNVWW